MEDKKVVAINCVQVNEKIYFVNSTFNLLYSICNKKLEIVSKIPEETISGKYLFGNIVHCDNKLFLIPIYAKKIWIYKLNSGQWTDIELPKEIECVQEKFFGAIALKKKILMLGHKIPGIVVVDIDSYDVKYIRTLFSQENGYLKEGYLNWDYVIQGKYIYTPILFKNAILKIDADNMRVEEIVIGSPNNNYVGIVYDGEDFWLTPRKGINFVRWDGQNKVIEYQLPECYDGNEHCFNGSYMVGDKIYFSSYTGMTYYFKKDMPHEYNINRIKALFYFCFNGAYYIQDEEGRIYIVEDDFKEICIDVDNASIIEYIKQNIFKKSNPIIEDDFSTLEFFIKNV